jgi:hypothetical protein
MTTLLTVLIVMACLWAMTLATLAFVLRLRSRSSTPPSPTPPTTPTPTSVDPVSTMAKMAADSMETMRQMALDLTQGRESLQPTTTPETSQTWSEKPIGFDYDSTPLSPGIEAVLAREEEETEQHRLLREREELQALLVEKQTEMDRLGLEDSSEGPWNGSSPKHANSEGE